MKSHTQKNCGKEYDAKRFIVYEMTNLTNRGIFIAHMTHDEDDATQ